MPTYNATCIQQLDTGTPIEGATPPSEVNDAIREIKVCLKNQYSVITKTSNYNITNSDGIILCNTINNSITLTLPTAIGVSGKTYTIKKIHPNNTLIVNTSLSQTIDGASNLSWTTNNRSYTLASNGSAWLIIGHKP